jgi:hypothetical protein
MFLMQLIIWQRSFYTLFFPNFYIFGICWHVGSDEGLDKVYTECMILN